MERDEKYWANEMRLSNTHWNTLVDEYMKRENPYLFRHSGGYYFMEMDGTLLTKIERDVYGSW